MHIILPLLGSIITILVLLNRLNASGIDIGWLNPFDWKRRREWAKKYHANPIYSLDSPMEVTALIMVALVKSEGGFSSDQKNEILSKFQEVFKLSQSAADDLFASVSFILKEDIEAVKHTQQLLSPSENNFTAEQVSSSIALFVHISRFEGLENSFQREVIGGFDDYFKSKLKPDNQWS